MLSLNPKVTNVPPLKNIPQTQKADPAQVKNTAGGFVFKLTPEKQLKRFLVLGSDSGTSYMAGAKLTLDNITNIKAMVGDEALGLMAVQVATEYSATGKASNNDYCLMVLAVASALGTEKVKKAAHEAILTVARTGTHILHMAKFVNEVRGWGRGIKKAIAAWYTTKTPENVAFQAGVKYRNRDGWTHVDVLRLSHPKPPTEQHDAVFRYLTTGNCENVPDIVLAREAVAKADNVETTLAYLKSHNLPREALPTHHLNDVRVWRALLLKMPLEATIRNLAKMTSIGLLKPLSEEVALVTSRLNDKAEVVKARLHPIKLLYALETYKSGKGDKGDLVWTPVPAIVSALENAFYLAFDAVIPSNKRFLVGLDISGSMDTSKIRNTNISCRNASVAVASVIAKVEPQFHAIAFDHVESGRHGSVAHGVRPIPDLTANLRLSDYAKVGGRWMGGRTDCSLPMTYAQEKGLSVDTFIILTDNETYAGGVHPFKALEAYRGSSGINAKLVVVGMTATKFSIANPSDAGMLDVVGFDPSTPDLISSFAADNF